MQDALRDARYGVRALRRTPGFTLVSALTLALGIGTATTVFGIVNAVLIKPLPYPESDRLVSLWNRPRTAESGGDMPFSATQFFTYRDENRVFSAFGIWSTGTATVTGVTEPEEVRALRVTAGTLHALGVAPALGRGFSPDDEMAGAPDAVMLTHAYWVRRHAGDRGVIGRMLTIDARPRTVIGVMPADFRFLNETPDLFMPLQFDRSRLALGAFNYFVVARLKPGVTMEQANGDTARLVQVWLDGWPAPSGFDREAFRRAPSLRPLKQDVVGNVGEALWVLMGAIALVLLIACANVANLVLARAERRRQEVFLRVALGATWQRIARGFLIECLLLGSVGGAAGLAMSLAMLQLLVYFRPPNLPRLGEVTVDMQLLVFTLAVSLGSAAFCGAVPLIRRTPRRTRNVLVVAQVAVALVLLIGSGLMARTFLGLRAVDPGFTKPDEVLLVRLTIPRTLVDDPEKIFAMQREIRNTVAAIPGVQAASLASAAPLEPYSSANAVFADDRPGEESQTRRFKFVSPGYFRTVGTRIVAGRDFEWLDLDRRRPVTIVSERLARELWQEPQAALGRRIRENPRGPWREVIGVVADVFDDGVHAASPPTAYWPAISENFEGDRIRVRRSMTLTVRSSRTGSDAFLKDIQQAIWAVNSQLPLTRVQPLQVIYDASLARTSFTLVMLAIAASMALVLGLVGVYGVMAYAVLQRTREIGIRVAIGARPADVRRMFVRQGLALAAMGVGAGLSAAAALTRLMSSLLFGISPLDPATYAAVSILLLLAAAAASYIPAHRAVSVDPIKALRTQ